MKENMRALCIANGTKQNEMCIKLLKKNRATASQGQCAQFLAQRPILLSRDLPPSQTHIRLQICAVLRIFVSEIHTVQFVQWSEAVRCIAGVWRQTFGALVGTKLADHMIGVVQRWMNADNDLTQWVRDYGGQSSPAAVLWTVLQEQAEEWGVTLQKYMHQRGSGSSPKPTKSLSD